MSPKMQPEKTGELFFSEVSSEPSTVVRLKNPLIINSDRHINSLFHKIFLDKPKQIDN